MLNIYHKGENINQFIDIDSIRIENGLNEISICSFVSEGASLEKRDEIRVDFADEIVFLGNVNTLEVNTLDNGTEEMIVTCFDASYNLSFVSNEGVDIYEKTTIKAILSKLLEDNNYGIKLELDIEIPVNRLILKYKDSFEFLREVARETGHYWKMKTDNTLVVNRLEDIGESFNIKDLKVANNSFTINSADNDLINSIIVTGANVLRQTDTTELITYFFPQIVYSLKSDFGELPTITKNGVEITVGTDGSNLKRERDGPDIIPDSIQDYDAIWSERDKTIQLAENTTGDEFLITGKLKTRIQTRFTHQGLVSQNSGKVVPQEVFNDKITDRLEAREFAQKKIAEYNQSRVDGSFSYVYEKGNKRVYVGDRFSYTGEDFSVRNQTMTFLSQEVAEMRVVFVNQIAGDFTDFLISFYEKELERDSAYFQESDLFENYVVDEIIKFTDEVNFNGEINVNEAIVFSDYVSFSDGTGFGVLGDTIKFTDSVVFKDAVPTPKYYFDPTLTGENNEYPFTLGHSKLL